MSSQESERKKGFRYAFWVILALVIYGGATYISNSNKKIKDLEETIEFYKSPAHRDNMFVCMANERRYLGGNSSLSDQLFAQWYDSEYGNLDDYCYGPSPEFQP